MKKKIDVLVIDDDRDYCEMAVSALHTCGQRNVMCVHDGSDGLDYLHGANTYRGRDLKDQPRLVLLDLKMVRVHGLEVLKSMRAQPHSASVPVVVLSATDDQSALRECYGAGANSVVRKTSDADEFVRKMRGIFEFWLNVNEQNRESRV
jgi:CheY-like chemotaxis protein